MMNPDENADRKAIIQAATDYIEGWYEGSTERMSQALHLELAKRITTKDDQGNDLLRHLTKDFMVDRTREGGGTGNSEQNKTWEISISDQYEEIAAATVISYDYVDYLHLVKQGDQWRIVNILFTTNRAKQ